MTMLDDLAEVVHTAEGKPELSGIAALNFLAANLAEIKRDAEDAALLNLIRNNTRDGLRIIDWKANALEGCQVLFPSPTLLSDFAYIDAAMRPNNAEAKDGL